MDTEKDKKIKDIDTKNVSLSSNNIDPITYFNKDDTFVFLYKKTERLTTAMYMITNLFSDNEPMKWTIRKKISDLLSFTIGYKDLHQTNYYNFTHEVKTKILEIISLLEVSSRSGLVSPMNFSIIKQEFSKLISVLEKAENKDNENSNKSTFSNSFFNIPNAPKIDSNNDIEKPITQVSDKGQNIKDIKNVSDNPLVKRNYRQTVILNLIKKNKDVDIKDIAKVITDCSEKTLQRELISLIESGIIKKVGERRWSKYTLA